MIASTTLKRVGLKTAGIATLAMTSFQFAGAAGTGCDTSSTGALSTGATGGAACAQANGIPGTDQLSVGTIIGNVSNVLIFAVGAISVIVLIIGGLRYVTSAGNPSAVQGAKNTILYAIIGIVVAVAAFAIVNFVFGQLGVTSS